MAKTITTISEEEKRKQDESALLDSWHPHIESAIKKLHSKFQADTKFILTESDLKCWLFYYLQEEKSYIPFAVHTEVTHYAEHIVKDEKNKKDSIERKYKFRDLSLLCPWEVKANEDLLKQDRTKKELLNKGFEQKANAIHSELKFTREIGLNNEIAELNADIDKLKNYSPQSGDKMRDFVIVCGSRSEGTTIQHLKTAADNKIKDFPNNSVKERLRIYLFDSMEMVCLKWNGKAWNENTSKKANNES
jgi:hypothetical protein